jgi:hypothetical protein
MDAIQERINVIRMIKPSRMRKKIKELVYVVGKKARWKETSRKTKA